MSAGGKTADRDIVRFNFPFCGMGADEFYRPQGVFLRSRETIRCYPVMHDKCVEPQRVEFFGDCHTLMRRAMGLDAARAD